MKIPESYRALKIAALGQGWTIERTRGGHFRWLSPRGAIVITGSSPGRRTARHTRALLRRAGLKI